MQPYYKSDDGQVILYKGNCTQVLRELPDSSIDVMLTSPPYNVGLRYPEYEDKLPQATFRRIVSSCLKESYRVLAENSRVYLVVSDDMVFWLRPAGEKRGYKFAQLLTWCKPNIAGRGSKITGDWNHLTEQIMLFRKGKRTPMIDDAKTNTHSYFVIPSPQRNFTKDKKLHVAQFPIDLPLKILARTPGNRILDPFCGSGSTGVAAIKQGKSFIGIDLDCTSLEIAKQRMLEAKMQPMLLNA